MGKFDKKFILTLIFLGALYIRLITFNHDLGGKDPYFHMRMVRAVLEAGALPAYDTMSYYPDGRVIAGLYLPLLPYFAAYSYKVVSIFFNVELEYFLAFFPAFFGALAVVPLYFLVREIYDSKTALMSAFIYGLIPASIGRTWAGFFDKEGLAGVLILIYLLFYIRSLREGDRISPVIAGLFLGLGGLTWGGTEYFVALMAAFVIIDTVLRQNTWHQYVYLVQFLIGIIIMWSKAPLYYSANHILASPFFVLGNIAFLVCIFSIASSHPLVKNKVSRGIFAGAVALVFLLVVLKYSDIIVGMLKSMFYTVLLGKTDIIRETVSESRGVMEVGGIKYIISELGIVAFLMPVGLYLVLKSLPKERYLELFLVIYGISAVFIAIKEIRFFYVLAPAASIFASKAIYSIYGNIEVILSDESRARDIRILFLSVLIFLLFWSGKISAESIRDNPDTWMSDDWEDALNWVNLNTPEDSVVISWWDYGYWVQTVSQRRTVVDGRHLDIQRDIDIARMFTTKEDMALKIIKKYNPENKSLYIIVSTDEFLTGWAINKTAGDSLEFGYLDLKKPVKSPEDEKEVYGTLKEEGLEHCFIEDNSRVYCLIDKEEPDMKYKLLPQLLPLSGIGYGKNLEHFELEYLNGGVYVYSVRQSFR